MHTWSRPLILAAVLALAVPASAPAEVPIGTFPECGTPDRPDLCPSDLGESWQLVSYIRDEWIDHVRSEEHALGSGCHADRAWQRTTGHWGAVIAVLDSGADWEQNTVINKHWLNPGELPHPQHADGSDAGCSTSRTGPRTPGWTRPTGSMTPTTCSIPPT